MPKFPEPLSSEELKIYLEGMDQGADLTTIIPQRFRDYQEAKIEEQKTCQHQNWTWKKNGRVCPDCHIFMVDWGD